MLAVSEVRCSMALFLPFPFLSFSLGLWGGNSVLFLFFSSLFFSYLNFVRAFLERLGK